MSKSAIGGIGIALAGLALGMYLDGGNIGQILQPSAALIVFGGTVGAIMVQFPLPVLSEAIRQLQLVFTGEEDPAPRIIQELRAYGAKVMRAGLISLDPLLDQIDDAFLRKALTLAVDGASVRELRQRMEIDMDIEAEREAALPKVFEAAGGFAPTIGILGAVVGLIQVMQRLENIEQVGKGIAVAFVATLYGVGSANLFFLPCAGKIKLQIRRKQVLRELMLEGVVAIVERAGPRAIEKRLAAYRSSAEPESNGKLAAV